MTGVPLRRDGTRTTRGKRTRDWTSETRDPPEMRGNDFDKRVHTTVCCPEIRGHVRHGMLCGVKPIVNDVINWLTSVVIGLLPRISGARHAPKHLHCDLVRPIQQIGLSLL